MITEDSLRCWLQQSHENHALHVSDLHHFASIYPPRKNKQLVDTNNFEILYHTVRGANQLSRVTPWGERDQGKCELKWSH